MCYFRLRILKANIPLEHAVHFELLMTMSRGIYLLCFLFFSAIGWCPGLDGEISVELPA